MHVHINPYEPWKRPGWTPWLEHEGGFRIVVPVSIYLHTHAFDGIQDDYLASHGFASIQDGWLRLEVGYWWDGSTMALNLSSSRLASAVHDALCAALSDAFWCEFITLKEWFKLRREADKQYMNICRAQGLWSFWATARYIGLRIFGPAYSLLAYAINSAKRRIL